MARLGLTICCRVACAIDMKFKPTLTRQLLLIQNPVTSSPVVGSFNRTPSTDKRLMDSAIHWAAACNVMLIPLSSYKYLAGITSTKSQLALGDQTKS